MFVFALDRDSCCMVTYSAGAMPDSDWEKMFESLKELDDEATKQDRDSFLLAVAASDAERPNAIWRSRIAENRKTAKAKRRYSAIVVRSALLRGVLRTISWLVPPPPQETTEAFAEIEEALQWAERCRPGLSPKLRKLLARVMPFDSNAQGDKET